MQGDELDNKGTLVEGDGLKPSEGGRSFSALLRQEGDEICRDVFMLLRPEDTSSGQLESGITVIYPGCRTKGHAHGDREEVYFFLEGRGFMDVDGIEWEVRAGDGFYVRPGPVHITRNPYHFPLKFFWITVQID